MGLFGTLGLIFELLDVFPIANFEDLSRLSAAKLKALFLPLVLTVSIVEFIAVVTLSLRTESLIAWFDFLSLNFTID